MCGRMTSTTSPYEIAEYFNATDITPAAEGHAPCWNVAPTQEILVIAEHKGARRLGTMRWGLVPRFATDASGAARMINARAETVGDKPAYREALRRRRCIVPVDGFYEWEAVAGSNTKQPWYFRSPSDSPIGFAGLWEVWRSASGNGTESSLTTCTILTTEASDDMLGLHSRMPLGLGPDDWDAWLDRSNADPSDVRAMLQPPSSGRLIAHRVACDVNRVANDGPHLVEEIESDPAA